MTPREAAAREAIRGLVARYTALGDTGRIDELLTLFVEDAVLEVEGRAFRGRDAIRRVFAGAAAPGDGEASARIAHHVSSLSIDLESEQRARGRAYFQVLTERGLDHWGRYRDEYRRESEGWRFARRRVAVDGAVPGGWAATRLARGL